LGNGEMGKLENVKMWKLGNVEMDERGIDFGLR
jgi:hypothetical protein